MFLFLEVSRDAVIGVFIEQGEDAKCGRKDVNEMRTTVQMSQYEDDELAREGVEYEKSRFFEVFESEPEIIKKAKWFPRRVRNDAGKWVVQTHCKVFDRPKGEYKFREVVGRRVEQNTCLDDGHLQISEDQQQRVLDDTVNAAFQSRGQGLSQSDLPQQQQQSKDLQPDLQDLFKQFLTDRGFAEASSSGIKRERERRG